VARRKSPASHLAGLFCFYFVRRRFGGDFRRGAQRLKKVAAV